MKHQLLTLPLLCLTTSAYTMDDDLYKENRPVAVLTEYSSKNINIADLNSCIRVFSNVTKIKFTNCTFNDPNPVAKLLKICSNLKTLDLNSNHLTTLSENLITKHAALQHLTCNNNPIKSINFTTLYHKLTSLMTFSASDCPLKVFNTHDMNPTYRPLKIILHNTNLSSDTKKEIVQSSTQIFELFKYKSPLFQGLILRSGFLLGMLEGLACGIPILSSSTIRSSLGVGTVFLGAIAILVPMVLIGPGTVYLSVLGCTPKDLREIIVYTAYFESDTLASPTRYQYFIRNFPECCCIKKDHERLTVVSDGSE